MISAIKGLLSLISRDLKAEYISSFKRERITVEGDKIAYVMLAANYNNLGDIAITKAQEEFLRENLPDYHIVIVPYDKTFQYYHSIKSTINDRTIITLIGGGNSGSLYEFIEWPRRFILRHFRNARIISFPQSVFYEQSLVGQLKRIAYIRLCKKCRNLTIVAREKISYDTYKAMFGDSVHIMLTPDIVFSLKHITEEKKSNGCVFVFRDDKEKLLTDEQQMQITEKIKKNYEIITYSDTCNVKIEGNGYQELMDFLRMLEKHELVITDRLHGMILSYIAHTPCIVLDNNNHKIMSTYNTWLSDNQSIILCDNQTDIEGLDSSLHEDNWQNTSRMSAAFDELKELMKGRKYGNN